MNEYRVISAKVFEVQKGEHTSVIYFYPQYRKEDIIDNNVGISSFECDEDGWMYFPEIKKFDNIDSAYACIERLKEVNEYGRKIHPYPKVIVPLEEQEPTQKQISYLRVLGSRIIPQNKKQATELIATLLSEKKPDEGLNNALLF